MYHQRPRSSPEIKQPRTRAERAVKNRQEKRELVENGCAHGVLVYAKGEPVGWCQWGSREDPPHLHSTPRPPTPPPEHHAHPLWRITCPVLPKHYRRPAPPRPPLNATPEAPRTTG